MRASFSKPIFLAVYLSIWTLLFSSHIKFLQSLKSATYNVWPVFKRDSSQCFHIFCRKQCAKTEGNFHPKKKELKFNKNSNFLHLKSFHKGHKDYHPTTWQAKLHIKSTTECQPSILHFNFACNIHDLTNIKICYTDKRHYLWRNFTEVVSLLFNQLIIKWSKLVLNLKV